MTFETELRESLRRKSPPGDFTARVMDAVAHRRQRPPAVRRRYPAGAVAAALLMITIGGWTLHLVEQHREGERAKEQLMLALRITSQKLHETQQHLQR